MAFGIKKDELKEWKSKVSKGEIAFLTHYWIHPKFEGITTVTKVGCSNVEKLIDWGKKYDLRKEWIHNRHQYPHFDLIGEKQVEILQAEHQWEQYNKFINK